MTVRDVKNIPPWRLVNGTQLGQILGVTSSRVSHLAAAGLPRLEKAKLYDLAQAVPWIMARALEKGDVAGSGSARQLYFEAMTERAHLETAKMKGDLYGRSETDQWLAGVFVWMREQLLSIPERITRDRAEASRVDSEISATLEGLADRFTAFCADSDAPRRTIEAAAKSKRRPVGKRQPRDAGGKSGSGKVPSGKRAVSG